MNLRFVFIATLLATFIAGAMACSPSPANPPEQQAPPKQATQYWGGDLTPVVSVKELMRDMIDPLADNIFESVGTIVDKKGIRDWEPKTDEEWAKVRIGAVAMAEGAYLLKIPRPFAPPGDENNSQGPDAPELSPAQIKAKLEKDPVLWQAKVEALRNVGKAVLEIVEKRDASALNDAGENLDTACEQCHLEYWYPSQREMTKRLYRLNKTE